MIIHGCEVVLVAAWIFFIVCLIVLIQYEEVLVGENPLVILGVLSHAVFVLFQKLWGKSEI